MIPDSFATLARLIKMISSAHSFSMLPSSPKIFHGRDLELKEIVKHLNQGSARIAILGTGGMGKTSLARAALHHPDVTAKYEHYFFVACDSATTSIELAAVVGSHLGLEPGKNLTKPVIQYLSRKPRCLLILDNMETVWEPMESRAGVEEFLSLLTDLPGLALVVSLNRLCQCHSLVHTSTDHNARCRTACQSPLDSSISTTVETSDR